MKSTTTLILAGIATALALATPATAGSSAAAAFAREAGYLLNGQFDRLYDELAPQQQRLISRDLFLRCYQSYDIPAATLEDWKQLDSLHVRVLVAGRRYWSTAVTVRLKVRSEDTGQSESITQTVHMLLVRGHWRWILRPSNMAAFLRHACPAG